MVAFLLYRDLSVNNTTKWVLCLFCWPTYTHGGLKSLLGLSLTLLVPKSLFPCLYFCFIYWIRLDLGLGLGLFYSPPPPFLLPDMLQFLLSLSLSLLKFYVLWPSDLNGGNTERPNEVLNKLKKSVTVCRWSIIKIHKL